MADVELRTLADDYWDALLASAPTYATFVGDHRFDDRIEDVSVDGEQAQRGRWMELRQRLAALDRAQFGLADHVTAGMLAAELERLTDEIDHRVVEMSWGQQDGIHSSLLMATSEMTATEPAHCEALVERARQVPALLAQACERFRMAIADGRVPPAIVIERSLNVIDNYLASSLDGDPFTQMQGPPGWEGEAVWRDTLREVARDQIRPAFAAYRAVFVDELAPSARPDDRPGLQFIPGGAELYRMLVRHHTSLPLDPAELHQIGLDEVARLREAYAEIGQRLFGTSVQAKIFEHLHGPTLGYATGDEIIADARRCVAAAAEVAPRWFGRLPRADCAIEPVPDFYAADAPGAYYFPPAPDGTRPGTYYVNTSDPQSTRRYETASIAHHEAIPGHHFQLAIALELDDLPRFQRYSSAHTAYVEGWGLYTERLADEMGLYATDLDRLGMLAADSLRSCRLVVDTGLHTMGWSRQQAIDFMVENIPTARHEILSEADRYIAMPAQALAYKVGQREIFRLRDRAQQRLGDRFDIKGFHDTVLGSSQVTLPILGDLVDGWVESQDAA